MSSFGDKINDSSDTSNSTSNNTNTSNTNNINDGNLENNNQPNRNLQQTYNMTRAAAIRMVLFSSGFALINVTASIQTIMLVIKGEKDESKGLRGNDIVGASMGILIYIVFGLPRNMKRLFCKEWTLIG